MTGEETQEIGREGLHRAKQWLEMTTRVGRSWVCTDRLLKDLLTFRWPSQDTDFSFDIGGTLRGGSLEGQSFMAEVKKYKNESDLPKHYREFLAKSYVAFRSKPEGCDRLMWIAWAPFQAQAWDEHRTPDRITAALLHDSNRRRVFGELDETEAKALVDHNAVVEVSRRLMLLTLCDEQEELVLSNDHYAELLKFMQVTKGIQ